MPDAVVIGAGPNGLVAANLLVDAGWSVLVLEAEPTVGGAVRSDTEVAPGFIHDTFSAFYPFAVASPVIAGLDLEAHGLVWRRSQAALAHPLPAGEWAVIHDDPARTAADLDRQQAGDGDAWLELCRIWDRVGEDVMAALLAPFPPVRCGLQLLRSMVGGGALGTLELLASPVQRSSGRRFGGLGPRILLTGNALHADFAPSDLGSGAFGWIMTMLAQEKGFPVPEGGAGRLSQVMADRLKSRGGRIQCGVRVERIEVRDGRAVAVRTTGGDRHVAHRAVLADVVAPHLYGGLVSWDDLPPRTRVLMRRFEWDPATVKVDWALSSQVPWVGAGGRLSGCVHIADDVDEIAVTTAQIRSGAIPARPFLLCGQMTSVDPTRSPPGTESMWAYTHVPRETCSDAGDEGLSGRWDESECERFADRMQSRIERHAPGFSERITARRVLGPHELNARNSNLDLGAINGGTARVRQAAVFRPVPGRGRADTPVEGLYLAGASAHPGGGVHGAPGANAARAALWAAR